MADTADTDTYQIIHSMRGQGVEARYQVLQSLYLSVYLAAVFGDLSLNTPIEKKIP